MQLYSNNSKVWSPNPVGITQCQIILIPVFLLFVPLLFINPVIRITSSLQWVTGSWSCLITLRLPSSRQLSQLNNGCVAISENLKPGPLSIRLDRRTPLKLQISMHYKKANGICLRLHSCLFNNISCCTCLSYVYLHVMSCIFAPVPSTSCIVIAK